MIENLAKLWKGATIGERHKLPLGMLEGVYIDVKKAKRIVAIKPKPAFRPVFQVITTKTGNGVATITKTGTGTTLAPTTRLGHTINQITHYMSIRHIMGYY